MNDEKNNIISFDKMTQDSKIETVINFLVFNNSNFDEVIKNDCIKYKIEKKRRFRYNNILLYLFIVFTIVILLLLVIVMIKNVWLVII